MGVRMLLAIAMLAGGIAAAPAPALAGGECVTRPEYRRVDDGMRKARVRAIFGWSGDLIHDGPHRQEYAYDGCRRGVVFITYRDNKVVDKSFVTGE